MRRGCWERRPHPVAHRDSRPLALRNAWGLAKKLLFVCVSRRGEPVEQGHVVSDAAVQLLAIAAWVEF